MNLNFAAKINRYSGNSKTCQFFYQSVLLGIRYSGNVYQLKRHKDTKISEKRTCHRKIFPEKRHSLTRIKKANACHSATKKLLNSGKLFLLLPRKRLWGGCGLCATGGNAQKKRSGRQSLSDAQGNITLSLNKHEKH